MRGGLGQLWSQPLEENFKYLFSAQVVTLIQTHSNTYQNTWSKKILYEARWVTVIDALE